jgi:hypothetical protein
VVSDGYRQGASYQYLIIAKGRHLEPCLCTGMSAMMDRERITDLIWPTSELCACAFCCDVGTNNVSNGHLFDAAGCIQLCCWRSQSAWERITEQMLLTRKHVHSYLCNSYAIHKIWPAHSDQVIPVSRLLLLQTIIVINVCSHFDENTCSRGDMLC